MASTVTVKDSIDAPASVVWPVISDFGGLDKLVRGIERFRTEGDGLGMQRYIDMGGGEIVERLTWLDNESMTFSYTMLTSPFPFERYVATVRLIDEGTTTGVTWQGVFAVPAGADEAEAAQMASAVYSHGIESVKRAVAQ